MSKQQLFTEYQKQIRNPLLRHAHGFDYAANHFDVQMQFDIWRLPFCKSIRLEKTTMRKIERTYFTFAQGDSDFMLRTYVWYSLRIFWFRFSFCPPAQRPICYSV